MHADANHWYEGPVPPLEPGAVWRDSVRFEIPSTAVFEGTDQRQAYGWIQQGPEPEHTEEIATASKLVRVLLPIVETNVKAARDTLVFGESATLTLRVYNHSTAASMAPQTIVFRLAQDDHIQPTWGNVETPAIGPGELFEETVTITVPGNAGYVEVHENPVWDYTLHACRQGDAGFCGYGYDTVFGAPNLDVCAGADAVLDVWTATEERCDFFPLSVFSVWRFTAEKEQLYRLTVNSTRVPQIANRNATPAGVLADGLWRAPADGTYYVVIAFGQAGTKLLIEEVPPA